MRYLPALFLFATFAAAPSALGASIHPHPRLLATDEDLVRVKRLIAEDPSAGKWAERIFAEAKEARSAAPLRYEPAKGIEHAREAQRRIAHLALAYRLTNEPPYLAAATRELLAAAALPSWEQPSFLATAELTTGVALGYDWLFDDLPTDDRETIRRAIIDKGLRPGLSAYEQRDASWVEADHNWNLVCNAGMIVGGLAVTDGSRDLAGEVIEAAHRSIRTGLRGFAPDGGWEEGPTYWNYGSRYMAIALASLRSARGSMGGLEAMPGLARTGDFRIHLIGPTGKNFNFADATEAAGDSPQMFALAWAFRRPQYATFERNRSHRDPGVLDLLWYQPDDVITKLTAPTAAFFRGPTGVASMRGSWDDPATTWVAFKGGSNRAHHGHLDLGTFVLDALGERWACDLGSDRYNLPGYSSRKRFTFYRYSTPGQNTLAFDGGNQDPDADAPLVAFQDAPGRSHAVAELTRAYGRNARRVMRGVALLHGRDVLVQDEIRLKDARTVTWTMHTRAEVKVDGRTATLRQNGKTLTARLLHPSKATFSAEPASAPPPQNANDGVTRLIIRYKVTEPTHLAVLFSPGEGEPPPPKLTVVSTWAGKENLKPQAKPKKPGGSSWLPRWLGGKKK